MAISFVASGAVATGANATVSVPAGYAEGDLLLIISTGTAASTIAAATYPGWTRIANQGAGQFISVHAKVASSAESAVTLTQAGTTSKAVMVAYRGCGWYDVIASFTTSGGSSIGTATQTTGFANDYVVSIYAATSSARTWTAPAATTTRQNSAPTAAVNGLLVVDELQAAAGATAVRTASLGVATTSSAVSISIREPQTCYWVGGNGTWDSVTKTNWATSSGGTAGTIVPGYDNVLFDANSNVTTSIFSVTLSTTGWARCNTFSTSALDGAMTLVFGATTYGLICHGNFTCPATNFATSGSTGTLRLVAIGGTLALTTNGRTINANIDIDSPGRSVALGGALTTSGTITLYEGQFTTFSNYAVTASAIVCATASGSGGTLTLGSSTVTLSNTTTAWGFSTTTNLTFNVGTSTINVTGGGDFNGGGLTYNNVSITPAATLGTQVSGSNTFNNLTSTLGTANTRAIIIFTGNSAVQTVTGTFTSTGSTNTSRIFITSSNNGAPSSTNTRVTINAATVSISNTDFYAIAGGGTGTWSGTSIGNVGFNTGITFTAAKTVYWKLNAGGNVLTSNAYATTSGGSASTANYPLPQDTVIFDSAGLNSSATVTFPRNNWWFPYFNASATTNAIFQITGTGTTESYFSGGLNLGTCTFTMDTQSLIFGGDLTLSSTTTISTASPNGITFIPTRTSTLTVTLNGNTTFYPRFSGKTMTIAANQATDTVVFAEPVGADVVNVTHDSGVLDISAGGMDADTFVSNTTNTRVINFGTGAITTYNVGGTPINITGTNFSYTGSGNMQHQGGGATATTITANTGFTESNALNFYITTGAYALAANGIITKDLIFSGFTGSLSTTNNIVIYGSLTLSTGMTTAGTSFINFSATSGTKDITTNGVNIDRPINFNGAGGTWQLQGSLISGSPASIRTTTLSAGTLKLNSYTYGTGIFTISGSPTLDFGTGSLNLWATLSTVYTQSATATTTSAGSKPVYLTNAGSSGTRTVSIINITEANAVDILVNSGSDIISWSTPAICRDLNFTGFSGTWSNANQTIYGSLTLSTGMTVASGNSTRTFAGTSGTKTITSNGKTMDFPITFNGSGSTWQLVDNMTVGNSRNFLFYNGTLDLNSKTLTAGTFNCNVGGTKTIAFGASGVIQVNGTTVATGVQLIGSTITVTGTAPRIDFTTGISGITKQLGCSSALVDFNIYGGTDTLNIITNMDAKSVNFTGYAGTLTYSNPGWLVLRGNCTLSSTMTLFSSSTFNLNFVGSGTKTFTTAGQTMDFNIRLSGVSNVLEMQDAMTLGATNGNFIFEDGTLKLKDGTTNSMVSFSTTGTNMKYLGSTTPGVQATVSDTTGTNAVTYLTIQDSNATGGASWDASSPTNVDAGNNTGWDWGSITASVIEALTALDVIDASATVNGTVTENTILNDIASVQVNFYTNASEALTVADLEAASVAVTVSVSEGSTLGESQLTVNLFVATALEGTTLAESQIPANAYNVFVTESIATVADLKTVLGNFFGASLEAFGVADIESAQISLNTSAVEDISLADNPLASLVFNRSISEAATVADLLSVFKSFNSSRVENTGVAAQQLAFFQLNSSVVESIFSADTAASQTQFAATLVESFTSNDQIVSALRFLTSIVESSSLSDSARQTTINLIDLLYARASALSAGTEVLSVSAAAEPADVILSVNSGEITVEAEVMYINPTTLH